MKRTLAFLLLTLTIDLSAYAAEAEPDLGLPTTSRITDVTVYADRAQVTRSALVELSSDVKRLAFGKLPGWIDEGSVRVNLSPGDAGQILDVQVHRTYLARASDEEFQKADNAVREIVDQIAALEDERSILDTQAKQVDSIRAFTLDKAPKEAAVREVKVAEYDQAVEFTGVSLRKIGTARRELEKKRRDLQPELDARQRKLDELRQRAQLEQRTVVVTVKAGAARTARLMLSYLLPGATWEPVHELRAALDGKPVALTSYAVVTQSTGEDWTDVNLSLSTQRSTATMKIPELEAFLVGSGRKLPKFVTGGERDSFAEANRNYSIQNPTFNRLHLGRALAEEFGVNQSLQLENARRIEAVFDRLQQRGTTAHFPAAGTQIIRGDARPVRVSIGHADLTAQNRIIAAPEASLNAARTVDLSNTSKQALLPGRVALYLDGAFLGLTETEFVAPGESFALFLGVEDQIKLVRTLDKKKSELTRGGSKTKMKASFVVTVENLSDREAVLQLNDRVPVSETDEVRVTGVKITPEAKPDVKGLVHWDLTILAKQSREFRLEYTLEYPNDFLHRASSGGAGGGGGYFFESRAATKAITPVPTPKTESEAKPKASPPPAEPGTLFDQIDKLERRF